MSKNKCRKVFVTGTDTDIGKTYITGLIIKKMIDSGFDATYFKAAASGNEKDDNFSLIKITSYAVFLSSIKQVGVQWALLSLIFWMIVCRKKSSVCFKKAIRSRRLPRKSKT